MNVVPRISVSPRSCFSVTTVETQPDDFSIRTSAGYSHGAGPVNASDRPLANEGQDSSGAVASTAALDNCIEATPPISTPREVKKAYFRVELMLPYGQIF